VECGKFVNFLSVNYGRNCFIKSIPERPPHRPSFMPRFDVLMNSFLRTHSSTHTHTPKKSRKRLSIFKHTQVCKHLRNYTISVLQLPFYKCNFTSFACSTTEQMPSLVFLKKLPPCAHARFDLMMAVDPISDLRSNTYIHLPRGTMEADPRSLFSGMIIAEASRRICSSRGQQSSKPGT
jgi:hypothetical protein